MLLRKEPTPQQTDTSHADVYVDNDGKARFLVDGVDVPVHDGEPISLAEVSDPSHDPSVVDVYAKDVSGVTELFSRNSSNQITQITSAGAIAGADAGGGAFFPNPAGKFEFDQEIPPGTTSLAGGFALPVPDGQYVAIYMHIEINYAIDGSEVIHEYIIGMMLLDDTVGTQLERFVGSNFSNFSGPVSGDVGLVAVIGDADDNALVVLSNGSGGTAWVSGVVTVAQAIGLPSNEVTLMPTGIASVEAFGVAAIEADGMLAPTGVASAEVFGTPSLAIDTTIAPGSVASDEAFGSAVVDDGAGTLSDWYPARTDASPFYYEDIPYQADTGDFVPCVGPTTSLFATVDNSTDYQIQAAIDGTAITVEAGVPLGDVTVAGSHIHTICESDVTFGQVLMSDQHCYFEGATAGTRTLFYVSASGNNILNTFMADIAHSAFTDVDFVNDTAGQANLIITMESWAFVRCRFSSPDVNIISNSQDVLVAQCNFTNGERWCIRCSGNLLMRYVVLDSMFDNSETAYAPLRWAGDGLWMDNCSVNGGTELTLQTDQTIRYAYLTNNHLYRTSSIAAIGTLVDVYLEDNTWYDPAWDSDADIIASTSGAVSVTNFNSTGSTFVGSGISMPSFQSPPGDPHYPF